MAGIRTNYTIKEAKALLAPHGMNISSHEGEYRVYRKGAADAERDAYYTTDIVDAIGTGIAMAKFGTPKVMP